MNLLARRSAGLLGCVWRVMALQSVVQAIWIKTRQLDTFMSPYNSISPRKFNFTGQFQLHQLRDPRYRQSGCLIFIPFSSRPGCIISAAKNGTDMENALCDTTSCYRSKATLFSNLIWNGLWPINISKAIDKSNRINTKNLCWKGTKYCLTRASYCFLSRIWRYPKEVGKSWRRWGGVVCKEAFLCGVDLGE